MEYKLKLSENFKIDDTVKVQLSEETMVTGLWKGVIYEDVIPFFVINDNNDEEDYIVSLKHIVYLQKIKDDD